LDEAVGEQDQETAFRQLELACFKGEAAQTQRRADRQFREADRPEGWAVAAGVQGSDDGRWMIRDGIPTTEVEGYLHARTWLTDAARLLGRTPGALAAELVDRMLRSGAIVLRDGRLRATAEHTPVSAESLRVPFPRAWPTTAPAGTEVTEST
jgi:hypothetical protein